ncbi:MAG: GDCCVxC domain-containing (seleno)protein [Ignavibacteria bacterium]
MSCKDIILESEITCPECGHRKMEMMPSDACVFFYECENCRTVLKPLKGDCCVFCSFGSVKCPPVQSGDSCC